MASARPHASTGRGHRRARAQVARPGGGQAQSGDRSGDAVGPAALVAGPEHAAEDDRRAHEEHAEQQELPPPAAVPGIGRLPAGVRRRDHRVVARIDRQRRRGRRRPPRAPTGGTRRPAASASSTAASSRRIIGSTVGPRYDRSRRARLKEGLHMAEVEIGLGKSGRRAYGFDDIAIVPSRRTRDPEDVDISWELDGAALRAAAPRPRPWTAWSRRPPPSRSAASAASACSTSRASGPATRTRTPSSRRSPSSTTRRPPAGCRRSTWSRSSPSW